MAVTNVIVLLGTRNLQMETVKVGCYYVCLFYATFNNISVISWRSVLLVEETGGPRENYRPVESHWQTWSHNVVHLPLIGIQIHNISCDMHRLHKSIWSQPRRPLGLCVLNATLNNIMWSSALLVDDTEKIYNMQQVTDKLHHIKFYQLHLTMDRNGHSQC